MENEQIKYVSVDPDGIVKGPIGQNPDEAKMYLEVGHARAGFSGKWKDIKASGYKVYKAKIVLLEEIA